MVQTWSSPLHRHTQPFKLSPPPTRTHLAVRTACFCSCSVMLSNSRPENESPTAKKETRNEQIASTTTTRDVKTKNRLPQRQSRRQQNAREGQTRYGTWGIGHTSTYRVLLYNCAVTSLCCNLIVIQLCCNLIPASNSTSLLCYKMLTQGNATIYIKN